MTVQEIIQRVKSIKQPADDIDNLLIQYINDAEWKVKREIVDRAEDAGDYPFSGITEADRDKEMLAPDPYAKLYIHYCVWQLEIRDNNALSANNASARFEEAWKELAAYWRRMHIPVHKGNIHSNYFGI